MIVDNTITTVAGDVDIDAVDDAEVNAAISTDGGSVDIDVQDDVRFSNTGVITTSGGDVDVTADFDGDGNGLITMADGAVVNADAGTITLEADEDITIGGLASTSNVNVTTSGGAIIDGGDTDTDVTANVATLSAADGIGDSLILPDGTPSPASNESLELQVDAINAQNTATGDINLIEEAAGENIDVLNLANDATTGEINLTAEDGTINVVESGQGGTGIEAVEGTVTLTSQGDPDNAGGDATDILVNNTIITADGDVVLNSEDNVDFSEDGDITTAGGNVTVSADFIDTDADTDGIGAITMDNGTLINADSAADAMGGEITLQANQDITLGGLRTNNNTMNAVSLSTNQAVVDGGDTFTDIIANESGALVEIDAGTGIGSNDALELQVANIDFDNTVSGDINLIEEVDGGDISISAFRNVDNVNLDVLGGSIDDDPSAIADSDGNGEITVGGDGTFEATGDINLTNNQGDQLEIVGNASFTAVNIVIGQDGFLAGEGVDAADNTMFGTLTVNGSTATITEDDGTEFFNSSTVTGDLSLESGGNITNSEEAEIFVGDHAQFYATDNSVTLGNMLNDNIVVQEVGVVADEAFFDFDDSAGVDVIARINLDSRNVGALVPNQVGDETSFGTNVSGTLFVNSPTAITSTRVDALTAGNLGIRSDQFVHLDLISLGMDDPALVDPLLDLTLGNLAIEAGSNFELVAGTEASDQLIALTNPDIQGTEVLVLPQAISFVHEAVQVDAAGVPLPTPSVLTIGEVITNAPNVTDDTIAGLNSTDGSIFISADESITIDQNVVAEDSADDPAQVTVFVSRDGATAADIEVNAQIEVRDANNIGIVNQAQTSADVIDSDPDTDFGDGTNGILLQNADGTADQSFEVEIGNQGEAGFRVGFLFDSANEGDINADGDISGDEAIQLLQELSADPNLLDQNPNLFIPAVGGDSEDFEFVITTVADIDVESGLEDRGVLRPQTFDAADNRTTAIFAKDAPFTSEDFTTRTTPTVLTTVVVRNDQNINLFAGNIDTVTNELNEDIETVSAEFAGVGAVNNLRVETTELNRVALEPTREALIETPQLANVAELELPALVSEPDTNDLFYVQVEVGPDDIEEVGDELQLTDPSKELPALADAEETDVNAELEEDEDEIDANDVESIIEKIESDPDVEAGYWYKVYQKVGEQDRLLFYHLKTGEIPQNDQAPEADFLDANGDPDSALPGEFDLDIQENPAEGQNPFGPELNAPNTDAQELSSISPISTPGLLALTPDDNSSQWTAADQPGQTVAAASFGLTAGSLLLASIAANKNKNRIRPAEITGAVADIPEQGFGKLARLKRKLARALGNEPK